MVHVCAPLTADIANRNGGYVVRVGEVASSRGIGPRFRRLVMNKMLL